MALTYYFCSFNLLKSNYVYFNHAYIRKSKAQLLLLSKYIDLNYVLKDTFNRHRVINKFFLFLESFSLPSIKKTNFDKMQPKTGTQNLS